MDILVAAHSGIRWLVLLAMLAVIVLAIMNLRSESWSETSIKPFVYSAILFDVQVTLGIIVYLFGSAWSDNTFIAFIHPALMLVALAVWHITIGRARKNAASSSYRILLIGAVISLVLVAVGIPWAS
jgi:hypothetical protein